MNTRAQYDRIMRDILTETDGDVTDNEYRDIFDDIPVVDCSDWDDNE